MSTMKVKSSISSPDLSCNFSCVKEKDNSLGVHTNKSMNSGYIDNLQNKEYNVDNNNASFSRLKVLDNSRNNDFCCNYRNSIDYNSPTKDNQWKTNLYNHNNSSENKSKNNYPDQLIDNSKGILKDNKDLTNNYEEYQLNAKHMNKNCLSRECNNTNSYDQNKDESYEEKTKYNKKKSMFNQNIIENNNYLNHQYTYNHIRSNDNIGIKNYDIINNKQYNREYHNINKYENTNVTTNNNNNIFYENTNNSCHINELENSYEKKISNLNNEKSHDSHLIKKLVETDDLYEKKLNDSFQKDNIYYDEKIKSLNSITRDDFYENAHINRERNMNHTKIFDYVECDNHKKNIQKNITNTFVPKYKNLSAKELRYNSLSGNDNITVLAANKMKIDFNRLNEKDTDILPDVYPFNLSNEFKNDTNNGNKALLEKLYPTNYNYINNYNKHNSDISLEQIRYNMNSSHIFDCGYDTKEDHFEKHSIEENVSHKNKEYKENVDVEKEEKRKLNPMYSDLFGRKTPDVNKNVNYEKIIPTSMNSNWMRYTTDKKYLESSDKSSDNLEYNGTENFHRKSYFDKDGYDNKKRLQDAIQKGSKVSLQAHLQSTLQNENNYGANDYKNVEVYYLSLHNIRDSTSDEEIKKVIKNSDAHIVSYESRYDLLSNRRKNNAKLCIRHNKGKEGLRLLTNLLSQMDIAVIVL